VVLPRRRRSYATPRKRDLPPSTSTSSTLAQDRHHRRRLIQGIRELASKLKPGRGCDRDRPSGILRAIVAAVKRSPLVAVDFTATRRHGERGRGTNFERKYRREGRDLQGRCREAELSPFPCRRFPRPSEKPRADCRRKVRSMNQSISRSSRWQFSCKFPGRSRREGVPERACTGRTRRVSSGRPWSSCAADEGRTRPRSSGTSSPRGAATEAPVVRRPGGGDEEGDVKTGSLGASGHWARVLRPADVHQPGRLHEQTGWKTQAAQVLRKGLA
jgi:hypothetical protein